MALTNTFRTLLRSTLTGSVGASDVTATINETINNALDTVATDSLYSVTGTLAGGGTNEHGLVGVVSDPLGNAVSFAKVMLVFFRNNGAASMTIGGATNIPLMADASDRLNIAAGGTFLYIDETGIAVDAGGVGTADLITVTGTATQTYDLIVVGSSS